MADDVSADDKLVHRTPTTVAERCLALMALLNRVHGTPHDQVLKWIEDHGVTTYLSAKEHEFIFDVAPSQRARDVFSWRAEALAVLLWALGGYSQLPPLNEPVHLNRSNEMFSLADQQPRLFLHQAQLRRGSDLDDAEADLYRQHWRVRDAQINRRQMPSDLDPDIVYERRYALSWLVGWGSDWDDVPTDT